MNKRFHESVGWRQVWLGLGVGLLGLTLAVPLLSAERGGSRGAPAPRAPAVVDRTSHGSVRHAETHVVQRPVEVRREPARPVEPRREVPPPRDIRVRHDVEVDVHRPRVWDNFAFGRRLPSLPRGFLSLRIGALSFFYNDGIFYQGQDGVYQEVYPPVGAVIPQPPPGALQIIAGNLVYYYAGGAFYVQQPNGTYAVAPTPMGVVVPELPPGAVQVAVNGTVAYQFNGIYYEPVFVNGVTQYETFMPQ